MWTTVLPTIIELELLSDLTLNDLHCSTVVLCTKTNRSLNALYTEKCQNVYFSLLLFYWFSMYLDVVVKRVGLPLHLQEMPTRTSIGAGLRCCPTGV